MPLDVTRANTLVRHKITGTIPERGRERRGVLPATCSLSGTRVRYGNNGVTELRSYRHMEFRQDRAKSFRSGNYAAQCPLNNRGSAIICEAARSLARRKLCDASPFANSAQLPRKHAIVIICREIQVNDSFSIPNFTN